MDRTRRGHAYEPIGLELEQMQHSRTSSSTSRRSLQTESDADAARSLIDHETRAVLNVYIEEGFDVPLITQSQYLGSPHTPIRHSLASISDVNQNLSHDDSDSNTKMQSTHEGSDIEPAALESPPPERPSRRRKSLYKGWRAGVAVAAFMTAAVFLVNLFLTIWASISFDITNGIGDAYSGDCGVVNMWNTGLHILINGLSSAMFSASNYTMQCITAPTRQECDLAHARGDWFDIGVPSMRNLVRIRWPRRAAWALLCLSSIPIHFLYNSAVFKQLDNNANTHHKLLVSSEFLETKEIDFAIVRENYRNRTDEADRTGVARLKWYDTSIASELHDVYTFNRSRFDRLEPEECSQVYSRPLLSGHSHLLLVLDPTTDSSNMLGTNGVIVNGTVPLGTLWPNWTTIGFNAVDAKRVPYFWQGDLCKPEANGTLTYRARSRTKPEANGTLTYLSQSLIDKPTGSRQSTDYFSGNYDHCLAKKAEPQCKLQFSVIILVTVILCNCFKITVMVYLLWSDRDETFVTFGDAIASWLDNPDDLTQNDCLVSKENAIRESMGAERSQSRSLEQPARPAPVLRRWSSAVSILRWSMTIALYSMTVLIATCFLVDAARKWYNSNLVEAITTGTFGAVDPGLLLSLYGSRPDGTHGLILAVLTVNLPQLIVSHCYLFYNGLFTYMHLSHEYSGYAKHRKALRVSTAKGAQRSTYWLQLPFTYGAPLIVASSVLHWLVSQSIFLARILDVVDREGDGGVHSNKTKNVVSDIGISVAPILACIILASCMLLVVIGMGLRNFQTAMPVAGSCSFALAAATHRPKEDVDASVLPVMWGEVLAMGNEELGHCCFTSQEVVAMVPGRKYAGVAGGRAHATGSDVRGA